MMTRHTPLSGSADGGFFDGFLAGSSSQTPRGMAQPRGARFGPINKCWGEIGISYRVFHRFIQF